MRYATFFEPFHSLVGLALTQLRELAYGIVQSMGHNRQHSRLTPVEIKMHLRRYISYAAFYLPDAFAGSATTAEQLDIVVVTLWIVSGHKTQQSGLAAAVGSGKQPAFATAHTPVDTVDDHTRAITHSHTAHTYYLLSIGITLHTHCHIVHIQEVAHSFGHNIALRQQQHHGLSGIAESGKGIIQDFARVRIQSYVGIVEYQKVGHIHELVYKQHLAKFARRKEIDTLVVDSFQTEPVAPHAPLIGRYTLLADDRCHSRHIIVHRGFVALLVVSGTDTCKRMYVGKLYHSDIQPTAWRRDPVGRYVPSSLEYAAESTLASPVGTYDSRDPDRHSHRLRHGKPDRHVT